MTYPEANLDPEDWEEFRKIAHELLDGCVDRLAYVQEHPWRPVPELTKHSYQPPDALSNRAPSLIGGFV